jgi:glycosyltransferase involved in cell wall biosynthesis
LANNYQIIKNDLLKSSMRKILYIQIGVGFLFPNRKVIEQLKKHYPGYEIELFDLLPFVKNNLLVVLTNLFYVFKEYFPDFIKGDKSIFSAKYHFLGTTYIFRHFSKLIREKVKQDKYEFIIQSQCISDASGNGIPVYIYTDHTSLNNLNYRFVNPARFMRTAAYIELEKAALMNADLVFVMSQNIGRSLMEQYGLPESKVKLAYVGSNTDHPSQVNASKYRNKNIIFVGKEWERKGGPLLIEAFRKVLEHIPDATLTIIGCRPPVNVPNCEVLGEIPLSEVARNYEKASVFCLPTVREPFGIVFIEAMFNRLPIVTNNMGAAPYLVTENNGYLLENNVDDYYKALVTLLSNPELCEEFGEESLRIAQEHYTWKNVGIQMARHIGTPVPAVQVKADNYTEFNETR